jgi:SAM-dependent methyltransferase
VFADPFVPGDADFYEVAYAEQNAGSYPTDRSEYGESLRFCDQYGGGTLTMSSCLEIGAGDGVSCLINAGVSPGAITALEYSDHGKTIIASRYPSVDPQDGDGFHSLPHNPFTYVFLLQVLDHLGDLDMLLRRLHRLLKPDGLPFISVPNPRLIEFHELNGLLLYRAFRVLSGLKA